MPFIYSVMLSVKITSPPEYPTLRSNFLSDTPISFPLSHLTKKYTPLTLKTSADSASDSPFGLDV